MGVVLLAAGVHGGVVAAVTAEQHAATIREALLWESLDESLRREATAALDALVAHARGNKALAEHNHEAAEAQMKRAEAAEERAEAAFQSSLFASRERDAAEERASQLEHERDELRAKIEDAETDATNARTARDDARDERDDLAKALTEARELWLCCGEYRKAKR